MKTCVPGWHVASWKLQFLNPGSVNIFDLYVFLMVDCFYRLYNNIYSLYQLNSNSTFLVMMTKNISITCQMPPKEQNLPQYSTTDINDYKEQCYFNP